MLSGKEKEPGFFQGLVMHFMRLLELIVNIAFILCDDGILDIEHEEWTYSHINLQKKIEAMMSMKSLPLNRAKRWMREVPAQCFLRSGLELNSVVT
jgi:hypothetical protein